LSGPETQKAPDRNKTIHILFHKGPFFTWRLSVICRCRLSVRWWRVGVDIGFAFHSSLTGHTHYVVDLVLAPKRRGQQSIYSLKGPRIDCEVLIGYQKDRTSKETSSRVTLADESSSRLCYRRGFKSFTSAFISKEPDQSSTFL